MKIFSKPIRRFIIGSLVVVAVAGAIFWTACAIEGKRARPLYGDFDMGLKCMGGHEIFLRLEESEAFNNCPGHREKSLIGRLERSGNSVVIHRKKDDAPWMQANWNGASHSLVFLKQPNSSTLEGMATKLDPLPQVTNPLRTVLPRYLPED